MSMEAQLMAKKIKCRECDATLERKGQHIEIVAENVCIQCAKNSISCSGNVEALKGLTKHS
jgi:hypothetical protein